MEIREITNKTPKLLKELVSVWENSVKATHDFLTIEEIEKIKLYVPQALQNMKNLAIYEIDDKPVAFIGVENKKIEMLFVLNEYRGQNIGKKLVNFAIDNLSANTVTVNEQNLQAIEFYKRLGFDTYKKTDFDEQGNHYPLLYMRLK